MIIGASRRLAVIALLNLKIGSQIMAKSYLSNFDSGMALFGSIKHPKHS